MITGLTQELFEKFPLVIRGESKEVRYLGRGLVVIKFLPTIYSFTQNRCAIVEGSEKMRLRASAIFVDVLREVGIRHAYRQVTEDFVLADLVMPHAVEFAKYGLPVFVPQDLTDEEIEQLPKAPPIEIIAKRYLTGTTKHSYIGLVGQTVRKSHPFYAGMPLVADGALPEMLIRFDWRNPLTQPGRGMRVASHVFGEYVRSRYLNEYVEKTIAYNDRVADLSMTSQLADLFIDVAEARRTAFLTAKTLEDFLAERDIVFCDLCMFIDESGTMVYGEISPDCGRYRHLDHGSLDKDEWRTGGSSEEVLNKWRMLCELIEK